MIWYSLLILQRKRDRSIPSLARVGPFVKFDLFTGTNQEISVGDAFVRELDVSKITLRLREKEDKKGDHDEEGIVAKLTGSTLDVLQRCLARLPTSLNIKRPLIPKPSIHLLSSCSKDPMERRARLPSASSTYQ